MPMPRTDRGHALPRVVFHAQLREWLATTSEAIVGSEHVDGRTVWVHVRDGHQSFGLHADTRRAAVERYLQLVSLHGDDLEWTVVPSQRGNMTAVAYGPERLRHKAFYLYVDAS
jgi:hypothetical protein